MTIIVQLHVLVKASRVWKGTFSSCLSLSIKKENLSQSPTETFLRISLVRSASISHANRARGAAWLSGGLTMVHCLDWGIRSISSEPHNTWENVCVEKIGYSVKKEEEENGCWLGSPHACKLSLINIVWCCCWLYH